jgi:UDP-glucose 4-epimerase
MNIVIKGGTGFIGQAVAEAYIKAGHQVFVTGHEAPVPGADYLGRDFQAVDFSMLPAIDILNHQAAITDPQHPDPDEVWKVNFRQALDLSQQAAGRGVKRIVYTSSAAVYGEGRQSAV